MSIIFWVPCRRPLKPGTRARRQQAGCAACHSDSADNCTSKVKAQFEVSTKSDGPPSERDVP